MTVSAKNSQECSYKMEHYKQHLKHKIKEGVAAAAEKGSEGNQ